MSSTHTPDSIQTPSNNSTEDKKSYPTFDAFKSNIFTLNGLLLALGISLVIMNFIELILIKKTVDKSVETYESMMNIAGINLGIGAVIILIAIRKYYLIGKGEKYVSVKRADKPTYGILTN